MKRQGENTARMHDGQRNAPGARSGISILVAAVLIGLLLTGCALFSVNRSPIARMTASPLSGETPLVVQFDASGSSDPDGTIESYHWEFGDGATGSGASTQHTYLNTGDLPKRYTVTLTVTDDAFATARVQQSIEVLPMTGTGGGEPGDPVAYITVDRIVGLAPFTLTFDGSQSEGGDGTIAAYNWEFDDGGTGTGARVTHTYTPEVTTEYTVTLFVWTSGGGLSTAEITVVVIVPDEEPGDERPHAEFSMSDPLLLYLSPSPASVPTLFELTFDPRGSYADAGHGILYYVWSFGDGSEWVIQTNNNPITHVYQLSTPSRTFVVRLFVYDDQGLEDVSTRNLTLTQPDEDDE
jgi:large repetitive protein